MMVMSDIDQLVRYDDLLNTEHEKCLEERISVQVLAEPGLLDKTRFLDEDVHQKLTNFQGNIFPLYICDMQNFKSLASQELLKIGHIFGSNGKMQLFFHPLFI